MSPGPACLGAKPKVEQAPHTDCVTTSWISPTMGKGTLPSFSWGAWGLPNPNLRDQVLQKGGSQPQAPLAPTPTQGPACAWAEQKAFPGRPKPPHVGAGDNLFIWRSFTALGACLPSQVCNQIILAWGSEPPCAQFIGGKQQGGGPPAGTRAKRGGLAINRSINQ